MADLSNRYPRLPERQWWALREKFKQSIPTRVTAGYLSAALGMQEKSAAANVLPALRAVGLIDDEGKPTQRAVRWRDDELYAEVVEEVRSAIYPVELLDAVPNPQDNRATVERWFANRTGHGLNAARKMAAFYELLSKESPHEPGTSRTVVPREGGRPAASPARSVPRQASETAFRLPGSSYAEVAKIIRGYFPFSTPVSLDEVARTTGGMHPTNISRNTGFLVGLGILDGGTKKVLTERGKDLARALDNEMPDEIRAAWLEIVADHDFIKQLLSAVRIRGGMDVGTLQAHIAYSAGQRRTQTAAVGAATVIDVLRAAALLRESDGKLFATSMADLRPAPSGPTAADSVLVDFGPPSEHVHYQGVQVVLQIQIQTSADDLEALAPRLKSLLRELRAEAVDDAGGE